MIKVVTQKYLNFIDQRIGTPKATFLTVMVLIFLNSGFGNLIFILFKEGKDIHGSIGPYKDLLDLACSTFLLLLLSLLISRVRSEGVVCKLLILSLPDLLITRTLNILFFALAILVFRLMELDDSLVVVISELTKEYFFYWVLNNQLKYI